jgi:solute carrier family 35 protein F3/4
MTFLGLLNLLVNVIPAAILVLTNVDYITWSYVPWAPLAGSASLGLVYNFLVNFGIVLLSPLVISIGMLCGIPLGASWF